VRKTIDKANKLIQMFLGRHKLPRIHTQTHETSAAINLFIYIGQFTWPRAPNRPQTFPPPIIQFVCPTSMIYYTSFGVHFICS